MRGFTKGDPRAAAAGRKGGRTRRAKRSAEYVRGYRSGARATRRHFDRWIADRMQIDKMKAQAS
jgi:hypothetical protein